MITHYNLQAMDHKIAVRDQEIRCQDIELIKNALKHYYITLERSLEEMADSGLDDIVKEIKDRLEEVRQLRSKLDG